MGKKIVICIDAMILPDKNAVAQRAIAICKALIDTGKKPIIVGLDSHMKQNNPILETLENYYGIDCYAVKYPVSVKEWLIRMITIKPIIDVIHKYGKENIHSIIATDYEVIALIRLIKYCHSNNIRLIADNVEWYGKSRLKFPINIVKNLDTKIRMEYVYPRLKYMICVSKYLYDYFSNKVPHIVQIPVTIDESDLKWSKVLPYQGNEILTIGYAGHPGLTCDKERIDWLIRAICELNEEGVACRLITAGFDKSIVEDYAPDLKDLKFYERCIQYLGKLSHIECLNMIATCDFSAIVREDKRVTKAGFPTKLSESFGCKTPVITTKSSNVADYIVEFNNGFIIERFSYRCTKKTIKDISRLSKKNIFIMHMNLVNTLNYNMFKDEVETILEE